MVVDDEEEEGNVLCRANTNPFLWFSLAVVDIVEKAETSLTRTIVNNENENNTAKTAVWQEFLVVIVVEVVVVVVVLVLVIPNISVTVLCWCVYSIRQYSRQYISLVIPNSR